jgi:hypothetical protein
MKKTFFCILKVTAEWIRIHLSEIRICTKMLRIPNTGVGTGTRYRYLGAGGEEQAAHAAGLAHAPGGDGRQHVLHRVVDGQASCHAPTRRVYVPRHQ